MFNYDGKTALITGASSGIGTAFAQTLAARHVNLVLVARSEERLRKLAGKLSEQHGVRAEVVAADLSHEGAASKIKAEVERRHLAIDLLVNNAGFALNGYFESLDAERDHQQVMVDVAAVVDLTHAFIPSMLERSNGAAIINIASTAAFQPLPYMAVYGASKSFILSFSVALAEEYHSRGIRVVALCPGATDTAFFETAGEAASVGQRRTAEQVAATGLRALEQGRVVVVDGRMNSLRAQLARLLPPQRTAQIAARSVNPRRNVTTEFAESKRNGTA